MISPEKERESAHASPPKIREATAVSGANPAFDDISGTRESAGSVKSAIAAAGGSGNNTLKPSGAGGVTPGSSGTLTGSRKCPDSGKWAKVDTDYGRVSVNRKTTIDGGLAQSPLPGLPGSGVIVPRSSAKQGEGKWAPVQTENYLGYSLGPATSMTAPGAAESDVIRSTSKDALPPHIKPHSDSLQYKLENSSFAEPTEKKYSLEVLTNKESRPDDVDPKRKELYLSEEDFQTNFSMSIAEWEKLPQWKRNNLKKDKGLF